jgi:serine/threonine protein kinase
MLEIKTNIKDRIVRNEMSATYKTKLIDFIRDKAKQAGPVQTLLMALHLGNHSDKPLSMFTRNLEVLGEELNKVFTDQELNLLLAATGSAFRYFKEFSAAAHFFRRAGYSNDFDNTANLAYEFGNISSVRKIDRYLEEDKRPRILPDKAALRKFLIEKAVPALTLSGDQYHGFQLEPSEIEALRKEASPAELKLITRDSACWLLQQGSQDIAKLYILAIQSEDHELIETVGLDFAQLATLPRQRTVEILQKAFPDSSVEVLRKGDTFSVRPEKRFVIRIIHKDNTSCILKELLRPVCNVPVERNVLFEQEILSSVNIDGIPRCSEVVKFEGLSFIQISNMAGDSLESLESSKKLPDRDCLLNILYSLCRIIRDLHSHKIAHFDISEKNILWDGNKVSLLGFDHSYRFSSREDTWFSPQASQNISPECASRFRAGIESDCFQFGLLLHRLLTGKHAFGWPEVNAETEVMTILKQMDYVIPMLYREPNIDKELLEPSIVKIIEQLLIKDPEKRMSAQSAYEELGKLI